MTSPTIPSRTLEFVLIALSYICVSLYASSTNSSYQFTHYHLVHICSLSS